MKKAFRMISLLGTTALLLLALTACGDKTTATYTIASDTGFAPFEYLDVKNNTYVGFDMDLIKAIAEDQDFTIKIDNIGFDAACNAVQAGQANGVIAGMTINDVRMETFDFSEGYFEDGQIMAVAKGNASVSDGGIQSLEDLRGKSVATKASTQGYEYANSVKDQYGFTLQVYEDSGAMYAAVTGGINAALFEDRTVIEWAIKEGNLALETVGEVINPKEYGFAVKKGENPELIEKFNAGLKNLKDSGKYDELLEKYGF